MTHEQFKDCLADYAYDFQVLNKTLDPSLACQDVPAGGPISAASPRQRTPWWRHRASPFKCIRSAPQMAPMIRLWGYCLTALRLRKHTTTRRFCDPDCPADGTNGAD